MSDDGADDDATSELMHLEMAKSESAFSYMRATRSYLERHGKPVAFHSDKHSVFRNNNATADSGGTTHLGRALDKLGVQIICANSPQAKGRVERANSTLQDWLVKAMKLAGSSSIHDANAFHPVSPATMPGSPARRRTRRRAPLAGRA